MIIIIIIIIINVCIAPQGCNSRGAEARQWLLRRGKRESPGGEECLQPRLKHSNRVNIDDSFRYGSEFQLAVRQGAACSSRL